MNFAHLHLMLNHLPIVGLGFAILFNLVALTSDDNIFKKITCWLYLIVAVLSVFPVITGDGAGEIVKTYPGVVNDSIELHENWGYAFFYVMMATGIMSIAALWFSKKKPMLLKKFTLGFLIFAIAAAFLAYQAGNSGGKIRHPEIENGVFSNQ